MRTESNGLLKNSRYKGKNCLHVTVGHCDDIQPELLFVLRNWFRHCIPIKNIDPRIDWYAIFSAYLKKFLFWCDLKFFKWISL